MSRIRATDGKVSIIVPAFNCEHTIVKCVNSILSQDYENIELIVIDDASNDNTLDELQKNFDDLRLKVIQNKENIGVSGSRNKGLKASDGEYIAFCDADDHMSRDMITSMVREMHSADVDIVSCGIDAGKKIIIDEGIYKTKDDMVKHVIRTGGFIWNKLFRRSMLDKGQIRFDDSLYLCEDYVFLLQSISKARGMKCIPNVLYHYEGGGVTTGASNSHFKTGRFGYEESLRKAQVIVGEKYDDYLRHKLYMTAVAEKDSDYISHVLNEHNKRVLKDVIRSGRTGFVFDHNIPIKDRIMFIIRDRLPFLKGLVKKLRRNG